MGGSRSSPLLRPRVLSGGPLNVPHPLPSSSPPRRLAFDTDPVASFNIASWLGSLGSIFCRASEISPASIRSTSTTRPRQHLCRINSLHAHVHPAGAQHRPIPKNVCGVASSLASAPVRERRVDPDAPPPPSAGSISSTSAAILRALMPASKDEIIAEPDPDTAPHSTTPGAFNADYLPKNKRGGASSFASMLALAHRGAQRLRSSHSTGSIAARALSAEHRISSQSRRGVPSSLLSTPAPGPSRSPPPGELLIEGRVLLIVSGARVDWRDKHRGAWRRLDPDALLRLDRIAQRASVQRRISSQERARRHVLPRLHASARTIAEPVTPREQRSSRLARQDPAHKTSALSVDRALGAQCLVLPSSNTSPSSRVAPPSLGCASYLFSGPTLGRPRRTMRTSAPAAGGASPHRTMSSQSTCAARRRGSEVNGVHGAQYFSPRGMGGVWDGLGARVGAVASSCGSATRTGIRVRSKTDGEDGLRPGVDVEDLVVRLGGRG